jgi:DUF971 family protein
MIPEKIHLHRRSRTLELVFAGTAYVLPAEFLRVYSPSAEVRGHGPGEGVLQHGKARVSIDKIEASGRYALRILFDDGHDSGIYSWQMLHDLCINQAALWQEYLAKLNQAGLTRDPDAQVLSFTPK